MGGRNLIRHFNIRLGWAGLSSTFRFQELLGHSDVSLTFNVYSHMLPDMGDAAGAMDDALG